SENDARVTGIFVGFLILEIANPGNDGGSLICRRLLLGISRRHLLRFEPLENEFPLLGVGSDRGNVCIPSEVEVAFGLLGAVAADAVMFEERMDLRSEALIELNCDGAWRTFVCNVA